VEVYFKRGVKTLAILITESVLSSAMGRSEKRRYGLDERICMNTHTPRKRKLSH